MIPIHARYCERRCILDPAKMDTLRDLGAARTLPRDADLVAELGVGSIDVVVDLVAGPGWPALLSRTADLHIDRVEGPLTD